MHETAVAIKPAAFAAAIATVLAIAAVPRVAAGEQQRDVPPLGAIAAMTPAELGSERARGIEISGPLNHAEVSGNTAANVATGDNTISGSFASSAGFVTVFQNTGNNALFQSSTVVNVNMQ